MLLASTASPLAYKAEILKKEKHGFNKVDLARKNPSCNYILGIYGDSRAIVQDGEHGVQ